MSTQNTSEHFIKHVAAGALSQFWFEKKRSKRETGNCWIPRTLKIKKKNLIPGFHKLACSPMAETVKNLPEMQESWVRSLGWEDFWEGAGNPLQYSCLQNPMDRGAWWAMVQGVIKSWTQLSEQLSFTFHKLGHTAPNLI